MSVTRISQVEAGEFFKRYARAEADVKSELPGLEEEVTKLFNILKEAIKRAASTGSSEVVFTIQEQKDLAQTYSLVTMLMSGSIPAAVEGYFNLLATIDTNALVEPSIGISDPPESATFLTIEQKYGPGNPEYTKYPAFYRFVRRLREQSDIQSVVGGLPFLQYEDPATRELRDIDPENPGPHAKQVLEQITYYMLALLDIEVFQQRSRNIFPSSGWNLDTDPIISLTSEAGKTSFPFEDLINGFPPAIQPYFRQMKPRLLGFSIWYSRAAQMADVADAKTTYETVVNRARTAGGVSGESAGHNKVDIGAIESRELSEELAKVDELKDLNGENPFWDLGDLISIARYEVRRSVRGTLLTPDVNRRLARGLSVNTGDYDDNAKRVESQLPLSLGVGARVDILRAAISASLEKKYIAYLRRVGRKEGGNASNELSTKEKYIVELAFRHALILARISNVEVAGDVIARDSTFSRGANVREWMKSPSSKDRDYFYRHDMAQVFHSLGLTMDEVAHVTVVIPETQIQESDISLSKYLDDYTKQYTTAQKKSWASAGYPKEIRRILGMFPPTVMNPDGSFNESEVRKYARAFKIKKEARIMGVQEAEDLILPLSQIKKGFRVGKNGQTESVYQFSMDYETRWNVQVAPEYVDWDTATPSLYSMYSKIIDFQRRWFEELGQMDKNNIEKVFKAADNESVKRSLVRMRGPKNDFMIAMIEKVKPLIRAQEALFRNKGGFTDGQVSEFALWMDKTLRGMLGTTVIELDDIVQFGFRSFMQYYIDYFKSELAETASFWSSTVFDTPEKLDQAKKQARAVGGVPKMDKPTKVKSIPEFRLIYRGIEDSKGVQSGMDSDGLFLPMQLAAGMRAFEGLDPDPSLASTGAESTDKAVRKWQADAKIRFSLLWTAFILYLNQYRYRAMTEKHPTLGTTENITTDSPLPVTMTYELRDGVINMFLSYQKQIQESMIEDAAKKGVILTLDDLAYAFGEDEMLIQMIRQGIVAYPQQAIEDYRRLGQLAKTKTYSDVDEHNTGDSAKKEGKK